MYGCETVSLSIREEHRLICMRTQYRGKYFKLRHDGENYLVGSSQLVFFSKYYNCMWKVTNSYRILVGKSEGKWELRDFGADVIILIWVLKEQCEGVDWIQPAYDGALWRAVVNTNAASGSIKVGIYWPAERLSASVLLYSSTVNLIEHSGIICTIAFNIQ
jgi:hypothetical protein